MNMKIIQNQINDKTYDFEIKLERVIKENPIK